MVDLKPEYLDALKKILKEYGPDYEVWIFGSRVTGKASVNSDIDLVLIGKTPIDWRKIEEIKEALSESDIPFMADVLDWHCISPEFQKNIHARYEVLQKPSLK